MGMLQIQVKPLNGRGSLPVSSGLAYLTASPVKIIVNHFMFPDFWRVLRGALSICVKFVRFVQNITNVIFCNKCTKS